MPANGSVSDHPNASSVRLGAVVAIDSVIVVVGSPVTIEVGLKLQLVSDGRFAHLKVTFPLNVESPAGADEKV